MEKGLAKQRSPWLGMGRLARVLGVLLILVLAWYLPSRVLAPRNAIVSYRLSADDPRPLAASRNPVGAHRELRVAAFNIAHGRGGIKGASNWRGGSKAELLARLDALADQIERSHADVVVLNEVDFSAAWSCHLNQARHIALRAGLPFVVEQRNLQVGYPWPRFVFGNAVLSRYPLRDPVFVDFEPHSKLEDLVAGNHDGLVVVVEPPSGPLAVVAVHLEYRSEAVRVRAAQTLRALAEGFRMPVVAAGDFNSTPGHLPGSLRSPAGQNALDYLLHEGGFDTFPGLGRVTPYRTFPSQRPATAIDWVLARGQLAVTGVRIVPSDLSDHLMVVASLAPRSGGDASPPGRR